LSTFNSAKLSTIYAAVFSTFSATIKPTVYQAFFPAYTTTIDETNETTDFSTF